MADIKLLVHAGPHPRHACPLSLPIEATGEVTSVSVTDTHTNQTIPGQCITENGQKILVWVVDHLDANEEREFIAHLGTAASEAGTKGVSITSVSDEQIDVSIAGELFTAYHFGTHLARPYCYPVNDPLGACVTRGNVGDVEGETTDHVHHRSIWSAYGEVNDTDNWSEGNGHGYTVNRSVDNVSSGPVCGGFTTTGDWTTSERDVLLLANQSFRFYDVGQSARVFDTNLTLQATNGDVHFGDTKEGGFLSVRVVTSMDASGDGKIENGNGAISESECWGRRAYWCDYSGPVQDHWSGIAVMEHPDTFRSPTYWHVRDYGLMGTNPFGEGTFRGNSEISGAYTLPQSETLTFSYRVVVHTGDATEAGIANAYHQYVNPPKVTVIE